MRKKFFTMKMVRHWKHCLERLWIPHFKAKLYEALRHLGGVPAHASMFSIFKAFPTKTILWFYKILRFQGLMKKIQVHSEKAGTFLRNTTFRSHGVQGLIKKQEASAPCRISYQSRAWGSLCDFLQSLLCWYVTESAPALWMDTSPDCDTGPAQRRLRHILCLCLVLNAWFPSFSCLPFMEHNAVAARRRCFASLPLCGKIGM